MTSSNIFDAVAQQSGVPRELINDMCISWSRDIYSLYSKRIARCLDLYDLGRLSFKSRLSLKLLIYNIIDLEDSFEKYKPDLNLANERVREIMTVKIDRLLQDFSQVLQNVYYTSSFIKNGYHAKIDYDFEKLDEYIKRFYNVLNAFPCQLKRKEPSEIQKKTLQSLLRAKAYIDIPDYLDCPMWPVRMFYKTKNSLYGMSMSTIVLERNKMIEHKREKGIESIAKHVPLKLKKVC